MGCLVAMKRAGIARGLILAPLLLCGILHAGPAVAQTTVVPVSNLRFGELLQGIPERVAPDDASASAEIRVTGKGRMTLVVALPASVMSPGGNSIPVQFAANDALYRIGTGEMQAFDPRSPLTVTVPGSSGAITLFVGGTVSPSSLQAPGNYTATITVQAFE